MSEHDLERLVRTSRALGLLLYRRTDGTLSTADCALRVRRQRAWTIAVLSAASALLAAAMGLASATAIADANAAPSAADFGRN
jgi:hypothetical protein